MLRCIIADQIIFLCIKIDLFECIVFDKFSENNLFIQQGLKKTKKPYLLAKGINFHLVGSTTFTLSQINVLKDFGSVLKFLSHWLLRICHGKFLEWWTSCTKNWCLEYADRIFCPPSPKEVSWVLNHTRWWDSSSGTVKSLSLLRGWLWPGVGSTCKDFIIGSNR